MRRKQNDSKRPSPGVVALAGVMAVAALAWLFFRLAQPPADPGGTPPKPGLPNLPSAPVTAATSKMAAETNTLSTGDYQRRAARFADFQRHPFPAGWEDNTFGWTTVDGKEPNIIRKLAHNELESERLAEENARIIRRQLVYHKDTVDAQIQRAKLAAQPIQHLVLPALDGQEVHCEITQTDLNPSGQQGTILGRVVGQPDSMVTFAFKGGREAFTILAPSESLHLVAEPREPGELIVKQIDPDTYLAGANCGNQ